MATIKHVNKLKHYYLFLSNTDSVPCMVVGKHSGTKKLGLFHSKKLTIFLAETYYHNNNFTTQTMPGLHLPQVFGVNVSYYSP